MPYKEAANDLFKDDLEFATIEEIQKEMAWPPDYISTKGLVPYIKRLKGEVRGLEIGTGKGDSAYHILQECLNVKKLITVDPYKEYNNWKETVTQEVQDKCKALAKKNLEKFQTRISIIDEIESLVIDGTISENSLDFIFLDGADSYNQVKTDCEIVYPLLKSKGLFSAHNFQIQSVRDAIKDFRRENKIGSPINRTTNYSFFWYKG